MNNVNKTTQMFCVWCGIAFAAILWVGMIPLASFFPPPSPNLSAEGVAALFQARPDGIRINGVLWMIASGFYIPFICVITVQMKRIEGEFCVLSYVQLIGGAMTSVITMLGGVLWCLIEYREYGDHEVVRMLNDLSWFVLLFNISAAVFQNVSIGVIGLRDKRAQPIFPRWLCWFNIWLAISFLPDLLIPYFKTGPFAWDGLFAFMLPMSLYFVWFIVMTKPLLQAIRRQATEAEAAA